MHTYMLSKIFIQDVGRVSKRLRKKNGTKVSRILVSKTAHQQDIQQLTGEREIF